MESLAGGMLSGLISTLLNNPFDFVKTRLQGLDAAKYDGFFGCFRTVLVKEGPMAFYSGIVPRLWRVLPGQGIIFTSVEQITAALKKVM
jgi:solute carrier family 25 citrate transporter 1